jgi:putative tricarboxylic transport membrane protein
MISGLLLVVRRIGAGGAGAPAVPALNWLRLSWVPLAVLFYYFFAARLGFLVTASALLWVLFILLGARLWKSVLASPALAFAVYAVFKQLLNVPLPEGFLPF